MVQFILQLNCCFTDEDKERCKPTIYRMVELATLSRTYGCLRLETEIEQEESFFLKTGLSLVIDGRDAATVKQILQNMILADRYTGWQLLDRLLMIEGVLAVQMGEIPSIIELKLSSMLGEKYMQSIKELKSKQEDRMKNYYALLNTFKDRKALPESLQFENTILGFDNRSIQQIIRCTDSRRLIMALNGCGAEVINKVLDNVSVTRGMQICENLKVSGAWQKEAIWAQGKVLETIAELENQGYIIKRIW